MNNHYESTIIVNGTLEEQQIEEAIQRVADFIVKNDGTINGRDDWGRKRLTYPIRKKNSGFYVRFQYDAPGTVVKLLARHCRIDDDVLRELTIMLTDRDIKRRKETIATLALAEQEAQEAEAKAEGPSSDD